MKKSLILLSIVLLVAGCNKEQEIETVIETLEIKKPAEVKVHLTDGINAVWDAGDKVSVFFNGGSNECWNYTGADGAAQGTITHEGTSYRVGSGTFTAVYPYDSNASMTSNAITTTIPANQTFRSNSYGWALMVSSTEDASLYFSYACAFIRLSLSGVGSVKSVSVKGNNQENLSGTTTINLTGDVPTSTIISGNKTVTLANNNQTLANLGKDETDFWIALAPGTYSKGLTLTVTMANGSTEIVNVTGPVSIGEGEVLCVHSCLYSYLSLSVDFTKRTNFTPNLPSSVVSTENTYSFTSGGSTYSITCHPTEGRNHGTYEGTYLIGFGGAWIKLPVVSGYALHEVAYQTSGQAGQPYLSKTNSDPKAVSNQIPDKTTVGETYTMTLRESVPNQQYYLIVGAGNLRMSNMTLRYVAGH